MLHIVCVCTLCKSVGNGRAHILSRRTLTRPPPCATPARLMATVPAGRGEGKRAGHGGHGGLTVATAGPRRGDNSLGGPKKGGAQLNRLSTEALNKPRVVLVVGVVAVAVNVLFYFGYYLPRMTPLIEHIDSISKSPLEAISKSVPEAISKSLAEAPLESPSDSPPESPSGSSPESPPQQQQQQQQSPPDSPSGSPPEPPPSQSSPPQQSSPLPQSPQEPPSGSPPEPPPAESSPAEPPPSELPPPPQQQQSPPAQQQQYQ
jgi:hypothetical protein